MFFQLIILLRDPSVKYNNNLHFNGMVSYYFLGNNEIIDSIIKDNFRLIEKKNPSNSRLKVNLAIGYSARMEAVNAVKNLVKSNEKIDDINYNTIKKYFYSSFPDPDLIIRTGGMNRLSDFLLLQSAYSELYFTDVLWPDFKNEELDKAINKFYTTKRKYGT